MNAVQLRHELVAQDVRLILHCVRQRRPEDISVEGVGVLEQFAEQRGLVALKGNAH